MDFGAKIYSSVNVGQITRRRCKVKNQEEKNQGRLPVSFRATVAIKENFRTRQKLQVKGKSKHDDRPTVRQRSSAKSPFDGRSVRTSITTHQSLQLASQFRLAVALAFALRSHDPLGFLAPTRGENTHANKHSKRRKTFQKLLCDRSQNLKF